MSSSKRSAAQAPYHHGHLRQALIEATESLLAERGADGFSLREVARRAGVSPSAPAHHFGDAAGLLAEVCTLAFQQLADALRQGEADAGSDPKARLVGQGLGYIDFAMREPARFRLMFRSGMLEPTEALKAAADAGSRSWGSRLRPPAFPNAWRPRLTHPGRHIATRDVPRTPRHRPWPC